MKDVGKDVKRSSARGLAKTVEQMMTSWTADNFGNFEEVMETIREGAPVQYAKLYMEAVKMGIIKESHLTVTFNRQQDYDDLQAMVRARVQPSLPERQGQYIPYEEIPSPKRKEEQSSEPEPLPLPPSG